MMPWDLVLTLDPLAGQVRVLEPVITFWCQVTTPFPIPDAPPPITPENPDPGTGEPGECVEVYPAYGQIFPNPYALTMFNQPPEEETP